MDAREKAKFEHLAQGEKRRSREANLEPDNTFSGTGLTNQLDPPKKKTTKKRKRDPDAPKPPVSAYILFSKAVRGQVKAANPDWDQKQVLSRIGEMWSAMDERQRAKYVYDATQDSARYKKEKADYTRARTLREHYDKVQEKRNAALAALGDKLAAGMINGDEYNRMLGEIP